MPYRKMIFNDGTITPIRRVAWVDIARVVPSNILHDMQVILSGSDRGKWTIYSCQLSSGIKLQVSNGKKVLEGKS